MRIIIIIIVFFFSSFIATAQGNLDSTEVKTDAPIKKSYFVLQYTTGPQWDTTVQTHQQKFFKEHSSFLSKLKKEGTILIGGRYSDKGFIVVSAVSEDEARGLLTDDASVQHGTFTVEVFPFSVFYRGCIE